MKKYYITRIDGGLSASPHKPYNKEALAEIDAKSGPHAIAIYKNR